MSPLKPELKLYAKVFTNPGLDYIYFLYFLWGKMASIKKQIVLELWKFGYASTNVKARDGLCEPHVRRWCFTWTIPVTFELPLPGLVTPQVI